MTIGRKEEATILQTTHLDPLETQNLCLELEKLETKKNSFVLKMLRQSICCDVEPGAC